ncbi:hemophore-related protein [Mycobacterium sp. 1274756.6]|uniref:hemophore-related protein n=1 Tax=Mycobacterium sp. 1274756.6 TaxID=1834076 RepID=UPI0008024B6F|nr:hemophore-related protein [Mycobacterium sp. 1274756.6]OBJ69821.1 hypothetical protein A5643_11875 [Mycobacterium sp. 1274756.6]
MIKSSLTTLGLATCALGLLASAGTGVAVADPDFGPLINTTCSYDQAMAALHAQNPAAAQFLDGRPDQQEWFRIYFGESPDGRANMIDRNKHAPGATQVLAVAQQVVATCHNY